MPSLPDKHCVYVLTDEPGAYKFGYASCLKSRVATLQTGNSRELRVVTTIQAEPPFEHALHRTLKHERVRLEWFSGPDTERILEEIRDIYAFMDLSGNRYSDPAPFFEHLASGTWKSGPAHVEAVIERGRAERAMYGINVVRPDRGVSLAPSPRKLPLSKSRYRRRTREAVMSSDGDTPWNGKRPGWLDEAA